jgi:hypothetical protein
MTLVEELTTALQKMMEARQNAEREPDLSTPEVYRDADRAMYIALARAKREKREIPGLAVVK